MDTNRIIMSLGILAALPATLPSSANAAPEALEIAATELTDTAGGQWEVFEMRGLEDGGYWLQPSGEESSGAMYLGRGGLQLEPSSLSVETGSLTGVIQLDEVAEMGDSVGLVGAIELDEIGGFDVVIQLDESVPVDAVIQLDEASGFDVVIQLDEAVQLDENTQLDAVIQLDELGPVHAVIHVLEADTWISTLQQAETWMNSFDQAEMWMFQPEGEWTEGPVVDPIDPGPIEQYSIPLDIDTGSHNHHGEAYVFVDWPGFLPAIDGPGYNSGDAIMCGGYFQGFQGWALIDVSHL